jgi:hypothetical protein
MSRTIPVTFDVYDWAGVPQGTPFVVPITFTASSGNADSVLDAAFGSEGRQSDSDCDCDKTVLITVSVPDINAVLPGSHIVLLPPPPAAAAYVINPNDPPYINTFNLTPYPSVPPGGYLQSIDKFIPTELLPLVPMGVSTWVGSGLGINPIIENDWPAIANGPYNGPTTYELTITLDGSILITGECMTPVSLPITNPAMPPDGNFQMVTRACSLTYVVGVPPATTPENFQISAGQSQTALFVGWSLVKQWYDSYYNDFYNGKIALRWADNSAATTSPYYLSVHTRIGKVKASSSSTLLKLEPEQTIAATVKPDWFFTAGTIAINPTNKNNLVWTALVINNALITSTTSSNPDQLQLWRGVSMDGGKTWPVVGRIDKGGAGITDIAYSDSNAVFDKYGNFYITSIFNSTTIVPPPKLSLDTIIIVSTDGGLTFSVLYELPVIPGLQEYDFNQLAVGGDGAGGQALWFMSDFFSNFAESACVGAIPIYGKGSFGTPVFTYQSSLSDVETVSLNVSENGTVFCAYDFVGNYEASAVYGWNGFCYLTGGVANLADGNFRNMGPYTLDNMAIFYQAVPGVGNLYTSSASTAIRGNLPSESRACFYDEKLKTFFVIYIESVTNGSQDQLIYFIATKDGSTWSTPVNIRDTTQGNVTRASMKQDPITGLVLATWYDGRSLVLGQPDYEMTYYGTILSRSFLSSVADTLARGTFYDSTGSSAAGIIPNFPPTSAPTTQVKRRRNRRGRHAVTTVALQAAMVSAGTTTTTTIQLGNKPRK